MPRNKLLQIRRGTYSEWTLANPTLESGEFGLDTTNNRLKVGPGNWNDLEYLFEDETIIKIKNEHDSAIRKGQAVYIYNEDGGIIGCKPYLADGNISKHLFIGLVETTIPTDGFSTCIYFGKLSNVNTTGSDVGDLSVGNENWFFGDKLYISSQSAGKLTKMPQTFSLPVGFVLTVGENDGEIFVNPNIVSSSLEDLSDVYFINKQNRNILQYNQTTSLWENSDTLDGGSY
jgi:hypothetical protein